MSLIGVHGVEENEDLSKALLQREYRPYLLRVFEAMQRSGGIIIAIYGLLPILFPAFAEWFLIAGGFIWLITRPKQDRYPFEAPATVVRQWNGKKVNTLKDTPRNIFGFKKPAPKGMFLIAFERGTDRHVYLSDDAVRTHFLVLGTTGSGKTRFLLSLLYSALLVGSGAMYVDGKADLMTFWLIYDICRRLGREDDLLLLSYLTGGKESSTLRNARNRLSNTNNFLAQGATEELAETIVGLMREAGGDAAMWKGRARILVFNLLAALVELRNKKMIALDIKTFIKHMPLPELMKLAKNEEISEPIRAGLKAFLIDLPGMTMEAIEAGHTDSERANEQLQFLSMQLTEVMSDLSQTYGHIFNTKIGEINFKDVLYNRRILYVMLPALAKSPDSLAGLGKMCIAQLRSALTPALGDTVEGKRKELINSRPADSLTPFLCILDEFGYYFVRGFAAVASQSRSLGIWCVFAAQELNSLQMDEGGRLEWKSIAGNSNLKVGMKIEEDDTKKFIVDLAEKANVARSSGSTVMAGSTEQIDKGEASIQTVDRVSGRDLARQDKGEATFIYGDKVVRGYSLFVEPNESPEAKLNQFLPVFAPKASRVNAVKNLYIQMDKLFKSDGGVENLNISSAGAGLNQVISDFNLARSHNRSPLQSACISIGMMSCRIQREEDEINEAGTIPKKSHVAAVTPPPPKTASSDPDDIPFDDEVEVKDDDSDDVVSNFLDDDDIFSDFAAAHNGGDENKSSADEEGSAELPESFSASSGLGSEKLEEGFSAALNMKMQKRLENDNQLDHKASDIEDQTIFGELVQANRITGASSSDARIAAAKLHDKIDDRNVYPERPIPEKLPPELMVNIMTDAKSAIETLEKLT